MKSYLVVLLCALLAVPLASAEIQPESEVYPKTGTEVLDLEGTRLWTGMAQGLSSPTLSLGGKTLAYLTADGLTTVDLQTFDRGQDVLFLGVQRCGLENHLDRSVY